MANDQAIKWVKAKVCVYADSVLCVGQMKDIPGAVQRWKGQVEDLKMYSSHRDAVGIDGEAFEFECKNFQGFSSLSTLCEIQQDLEKRKIQPEEFTDWIIFMSMFNDIVCNTNDENCVSNAEKVNNYATRFSEGHWTFLGPGLEEKWCGSSNHARKGQWNCTAAKMVQRFKETGHPVFNSISAPSRGILKQKKGKTSIHFNGDSLNTEILFQPVRSVNQLSVYGAVANWCYQFGPTEEEKGRPEEVQLLVSPPTRATGNRMPERVMAFDELAG